MRIFNFGSLNIDHVYRVSHLVRPGETITSCGYARHAGGKGLNQSIALARAGAPVEHVGAVGSDGRWLLDLLADAGVAVSFVREVPGPSGHAVIQVADDGENAIVIEGGANQQMMPDHVETALSAAARGDWVLLQNEINDGDAILREAHRLGLKVALNPAPMSNAVKRWPLEVLSLLVVNQSEGEAVTGAVDAEAILAGLGRLAPEALCLLTLGAEGARGLHGKREFSIPAHPAEVVDTTAAGDCFMGYFLAGLVAGREPAEAGALAARAAALSVSRPGAASSIPNAVELSEID